MRRSALFILFAIFVIGAKAQTPSEAQTIDGYIKNAPFHFPDLPKTSFPDKKYSIVDYGAVSDGQTLNTNSFNKAINACTSNGGGNVIVPPGLWLTGPIQLQSNINLVVERGAIILFTKDHTQYPMINASNTSNNIVTASPIYAYGCKNIAITGEGIIDGAGESWRPVKKIKTTASQWKELTTTGTISGDGSVWWPTKEAMEGEEYLKKLKEKNTKASSEDYLAARDFLRPYMCYLVNCENILIRDVTLRNSPKFVFLPSNCTNLILDHVNIFNEWWAQNGDGIDLSACKNVVVYKCNVSAGDDGICMKSSGNSGDRNKAMLSNVIVAGCNVYHAHGGFVIGSNTDGGVDNVFVKDCNFIGTDVGIRIKSNAGRGGLVHHIYINNIYMSDITNEAILFDTYYEDVPAGKVKTVSKSIKEKTPEFTDFYLTDIYCNGAKTAIAITGLPEMPAHDLHLSNVTISSTKGAFIKDAGSLEFKNVKIITPADPLYVLNNVKGLNITNGYFPLSGEVFIKADNKTEKISATLTDKRDISRSIIIDK